MEERLLASGRDYPEMLEASAATRLQLQRLGYRAVFLLLRCFLEQAVFENLIARLEETLEEHDAERAEAPVRTILFADLSGYTGWTEAAGDAAAGPVVQRDGDYFGRTVNLGARLADAPELRADGERSLSGFSEPVPVSVAVSAEEA